MKRTILLITAIFAIVAVANAQPQFKRGKKNERPQYTLDAVGGAYDQAAVIKHKGFTLCYDQVSLIPKWVSYELTDEEASATIASRTDEFLPDPAVKGRQADTRDYSGSGYDRGHMAAAADMKWDIDAMRESFYLTNICPQNRTLNAGLWLELEQKCRYWAKKYGRVWIVCGPMFTSGHYDPIGKNGVMVPDALFKCVCMQVGDRWTCAAFVFPNIECGGDLTRYIFPVISAEYLTGLSFFDALPLTPSDIQTLKISTNTTDWIIPGWTTK